MVVKDGDTKGTLVFASPERKIDVLQAAAHACLPVNNVTYNEMEARTFET